MARQTGGPDKHPGRPFSCEWDWAAGSLGKQKPVGMGIPTGYTFKQIVIDYDRAPSRKKRRLK